MKIYLLIVCLLLSTVVFAQRSAEIGIEEIIIGEALLYPFSTKEWEENTLSYLGYYIQLDFENGELVALSFSDKTPPIVTNKNDDLLFKINSSLVKNEITQIQDGRHIFPIISEIITNPTKKLKNNLEEEMDKMMPEPSIINDKKMLVHKPLFVQIYQPLK